MSLLDEIKKITRPYDDEDEFYDDDETEIPVAEEEVPPAPPQRPAAKPKHSTFVNPAPPQPAPAPAPRRDSVTKAEKVVNLNSGAQFKVVFVMPKSFPDAANEIADHLRDRRAVLINLEQANAAEARRLLDFLSGVAYALDGKIRPIATKTYIITPFNVDLMGESLDELEAGGIEI